MLGRELFRAPSYILCVKQSLKKMVYAEYSNIFQYISKKMQLYTVYLYLVTALHVSGGTSTHHQERVQMYLQHLR